jgi:ribosome-associated protein
MRGAGRGAPREVPSTEQIAPSSIQIQLTADHIELNQLLKMAGLVQSGGAGKMMVAMGGVRVDGQEELRKTCKIRAGQVVKAGDVRIRVVAADKGATPEAAAPAADDAGE